jgi:hypothetical protein
MEPAQPAPAAYPPTTTASDARAAAWRLTTFRILRILVTLQAAVILTQAITAGLLLSGTPNIRGVHGLGAILLILIGLAQVVVAILHVRPGHGTPRLLGPSIGLLVAYVIQAALGETHIKAVHIPLGVVMFGGVLTLTRQLWSAPGPGGSTRGPAAESGPAEAATPASGGQP